MTAEALDRHVDTLEGGPPSERLAPGSKTSSPLEEVTVHPGPGGDWHLVTRGLSELDAKQGADPAVSGWGFELTMRVERDDAGPAWAVDLLTNLAAYVWRSGNAFAAGHHVDLRGPIRLGADTALTAAALTVDPLLGRVGTPNGEVEFLQLVALTADELELCRAWNTEGVVGMLAAADPLLVTRLDRASLLSDPVTAAKVARAAAHDGSALTELRVATLSWRVRRFGPTVVRLGAGASSALGPALRRELIAPGARFEVLGPAGSLRFVVAAEGASWRLEGDEIEIALPVTEVETLASLFDGRTGSGRHASLAGLRFTVVD